MEVKKVVKRDILESEFIFIFEKEFRGEPVTELLELSLDNEAVTVNDEVRNTVEGVFAHLNELDGVISGLSKKRAIDRIPKINLAALRLAIYKIMGKPDKDYCAIIIKEVVDLVHKYAQDSDVSFVNGVLGAYSRSLKETEK